MFSIGGNFVIVFLVVYFMINQGINCPDATNEKSTDTTSNRVISSVTTFNEYRNVVKIADYAIIFVCSVDVELCTTVSLILKKLINDPKYKEIKFFYVDKQDIEKIKPGYSIFEVPSIIATSKEKFIDVLGSKTSQKKKIVESLFFKLLNTKLEMNANEKTSTELTKIGVLSNVTDGSEYETLVAEAKFAIIIYYSQNDENCETIYRILKTMMNDEKYRIIKLLNVDITNHKTITKDYSVSKAPSLIALYEGKAVANTTSTDALFVEKFLKELLHYSLERRGIFWIISSLDQYIFFVEEANYAIIYFSSKNDSSDEKICEMLKEQMGYGRYKNFKLYNVDISQYKKIMPFMKIDKAPAIAAFRKGKYIMGLPSVYAKNKFRIQSLFFELFSSMGEWYY